MKEKLSVILIWFIVAAFFYAAIWTNKENTLSECFVLTGFTSICQILLTIISYLLTQIEN
jgi:preprotein translocase subunit SecE